MRRNCKPKALIISDQPTTGPLWSVALEQNQIVAVFEKSPANAAARWLSENPDLVILDIRQAKQALNLIIDLRQETLAPILLLLREATEEFLIQAYEAGVDECIFKPISPSLFVAKVNAWLRHTWNQSTDTLVPLKIGGLRLVPVERLVEMPDKPPLRLTYLEFRLLYILLSRPGYCLSSEELIQRVWGYECAVDTTVLKNMVYRLRQKIETDPSDPKRILTVPGIGYKFDAEPGQA